MTSSQALHVHPQAISPLSGLLVVLYISRIISPSPSRPPSQNNSFLHSLKVDRGNLGDAAALSPADVNNVGSGGGWNIEPPDKTASENTLPLVEVILLTR